MTNTLHLNLSIDILAVLAPCGPLKYIIERGDSIHKDPLPGLMYKGRYFMLGLGDFVFYGALLGRSALINYQTLITTLVGVLMGLAATIIITTRGTRAMPALPLSIACGLIFYGLTTPLIIPMCNHIADIGAAL
jgi:hypothetical protein